jgi:RHS repeat-associated protein
MASYINNIPGKQQDKGGTKTTVHKRLQYVLCGFLLALLPLLSHASKDPEAFTWLEGSSIATGNFAETKDPVYYTALQQNIEDVTQDRYKNVIALFVKEETSNAIPTDFTCTVTMNLTYTDVSGTASAVIPVTLEVSYTKAAGLKYNARNYYYFSDARQAKVVITGVNMHGANWNVTDVLRLENRLQATRDYKFLNQQAAVFSQLMAKPDEVMINWTYAPAGGATHFDVEWAWIDDFAADKYKTVISGSLQPDARLLFKRNATRITVDKGATSCTIPLLYDGPGKLYYRIRPVQYRENGDVRIGVWNVTTTVSTSDYYAFTGHEDNQLNWQASTSYAEDGKRKTVVQYFDGTLRNRQTVTKDNSTADVNTVVAETYYDYQGRPSIAILPAPTLNTVIGYARNFNRFLNSAAYPKDNYDLLSPGVSVCAGNTPAMDNATGAAKYYSPGNPLLTTAPVKRQDEFIPDAQGYPYTETRYTPDGTGRVAEQSGVGPTHQLGAGGHQTKYYYGTPDQKELDALFGLEAGNASHYFKNMVRDANGQYSVSYTDMHGRTVATALAGSPPASLAALPSYAASVQTIKKDLVTPENNIVQGRSVVSATTLLVTKQGLHTFNYSLSPQSADIVACNPPGQTVCYDCYYDLDIRIVDACGAVLAQHNKSNFTFGNYDVTCGNAVPGIVFNFSHTLAEGEYNVIKTLTVSKAAQDWYSDNVFKDKNICNSLEDFYNQAYQALLGTSDCANMTCATCTTAVGTLANYTTRFLQQAGIANPTPALLQELEQSWTAALANCNLICNKKETQLDIIRRQMLEDMVPPMGQYARANVDLNHDGDTNDNWGTPPNQVQENGMTRPYNVLSNAGYPAPLPFTATAPYYKKPLTAAGQPGVYQQAGGQKDPLAYEADGLTVLNSLNAFTSAFSEKWADGLLPYHPEYARLKYADANLQPAYLFDARLDDVDNWVQAQNLGYISSNAAAIVNSDPFFSGVGLPYRQTMIDYITTAWYSGKNFWQMAYAGIACANEPAGSTCAANAPANPMNSLFVTRCTADKDYMWQIFKGLYIAVKNDFINTLTSGLVNPDIYTNLKNHQYQRRFGSVNDYLSEDALMSSLLNNINQTPPNTGGVDNITATALQAQYVDNCESYVAYWTNEFEKCPEIKNHLQHTQLIYDLTTALKDICVEGSDESHPMGSASVKPGSAQSPASFPAAIDIVFGKYNINVSALCHPYMIDYPRPYSQQPPLNDVLLVDKQDDCLCTKLTDIKAAMVGLYSLDPAFLPDNMANYLRTTYGYTVAPALLSLLLDGCNGQANCNTNRPPLVVPGFLLDCKPLSNNCISCGQYNEKKQAFKTEFHPVFDAVLIANPQTPAEIQQNDAFAAYMNNVTGFNKRWQEYLAFENTCSSQSISWNCTQLQHVADDYMASSSSQTGTSCEQAFADYFNGIFGTNYTYAQIRDVYWINCGITLQPCRNAVGGRALQLLTLRMYHQYGANYWQQEESTWQQTFTSLFNTEFGVDYTQGEVFTLVEKLLGKDFVVCGQYSYPRLYVLDSAYRAATYNLGWMNNNCETSFTNYFNIQTQSSFDWAAIIAQYQQQGLELKVCVPPASCQVLEQLDNSYANQGGAACASVDPSTPDYCKACYTSFINKQLHTSYTYEQLMLLHQRACANQPQNGDGYGICGNSFSCEELSGFYSGFIAQYADSIGNGNCRSFFTGKFNQQYGTQHSFVQIAAIYQLHCGQEPPLCQEVAITSREQVEKVLNDFMELYPNPAGYFGTGCQQGFTNFFNQRFSSNYSYAEVNNFYLSLMGEALAVCNVVNTEGLLSFKDNYINYWVAYPMPHQLTKDLFTVLYNRQFAPGQPHTWLDIQHIYAAAGIALPIYNADSTAQFTCSKLAGVKKAYQEMYMIGSGGSGTMGANFSNVGMIEGGSTLLIDNSAAEAAFAAFFNLYFGTTHTYSDIIAIATGCGISKYNPIMAEGEQSVTLIDSYSPQSVLPVKLCGRNEPPAVILPPVPGPCDYIKGMALRMATGQYKAYLTQQYNQFDNVYLNKCLQVQGLESFTVDAPVAEYHYTLYYYDQAGSLVKTVPPAGANPNFDNNYLTAVAAARKNGTGYTAPYGAPAHTLATQYRYNTLGQVMAQYSPDGGKSQFWYDRLGRLVVSQNAKQQQSGLYSFTQYDALGRITEVGEKMQATDMTQAISQSESQLTGWLAGGSSKKQLTRTVYDAPYSVGNFQVQVLAQRNLRNRVSYTYTLDDEADQTPTRIPWQAATLYTYDIHGNVDVLVQDYRSSLGLVAGNRWKRMEYQYDLISGKVNQVAYQPGMIDGYYHRYEYDAENKLTEVYSSRDALYWERQAAYSYYRHGPLSRVTLGQLQVQGVDYAYTLQGWLKGVNSSSVDDGSYDIGQDGMMGSPHAWVGRDVYSFSLNYYAGDYKAISSTANAWAAGSMHNLVNSDGQTVATPLYNGNIASMLVNIPQLGAAQLYGYKYDQLNRIVSMDAFAGLNNTSNSFAATAASNYKERVSYDANGNILNYLRNGDAARLLMDNMTYHYKPGKNQLDRVVDIAPDVTANYSQYNDIKQGQQAGNYSYDAIGNLTSDAKEGLSNINWTVYGKISSIQKADGSSIVYTYDASGNRISKTVSSTIGGIGSTTTYYVRDASGNVMAVYESGSSTGYNLTQTEVHLYGSSRLGILNTAVNVQSGNLLVNNTGSTIFTRGEQFFELSNHLQNVLVTVSDKKTLVDDGTYSYSTVTGYTKVNSAPDGKVDYYKPDIITANDYYPFGSLMPGRNYNAPGKKDYKYGFNGKENDNDVKGVEGGQQDYGLRIYDPRLGRFLSVDPLTNEYPELTPYQFAGNNPIKFIDLDGGEPKEPPKPGVKEGETQSTSDKKFVASAGARGGTWVTTTTQWFWHQGGVDNGKGGLTADGWYDDKGYQKQISTVASQLAGYSNMYSSAGGHNWSDAEKANVGNTSLGQFLKRNMDEANVQEKLATKAQTNSSASNVAVSGRADFSAFNVDDIIGIGMLVKQLTKQLAFKTFYSVQSLDDIARLRAGGNPWPTSPTSAHLGEGIYTWSTKNEATAYLRIRAAQIPNVQLKVVKLSMHKTDFKILKSFVVKENSIGLDFINKHCRLYGLGQPHGFQYIQVQTGNFGVEHYFNTDAFGLFRMK